MTSTVLNPFVVGGAIGGQNGRGFVGREDIFSFVVNALMVERRAPILLYGQRRMGKSSILKQIPRRLPPDFACVYFDLQGTASMKTAQLLYGLGLAIADKLEIDPPEREDCSEERFPAFLRRAIERLGGREERLVLLFDEFDVIDQSLAGAEVAASRFIPYLGRLVEQFPRIGYILVVGRRAEELSSEFLGSILKDAITKQIGRLTEAQVKTLARDLAAGNLTFNDEALDRIFFLTNGHPFCTQALCNVIWNVATDGLVTSQTVDRALPQALEVWSNGLNWVYDGMSKPAHRLFLSALAETGETTSLARIDQTLRDRRIAPDSYEFSLASRDLLNWDVVTQSDAGLRFTVPMIGEWIAKNRPLDALRDRTVLFNPRAQRYYELAFEALSQDRYDEAIGGFQNALASNPAFLDALRGLVKVLTLRRKPGDLKQAEETYLRIRDLEPDEPLTPFLAILADRIDEGGLVSEIADVFEKLKTLDPNGPFYERAVRRLEIAAGLHRSNRSPDDIDIANAIDRMLGHRAPVLPQRWSFGQIIQMIVWILLGVADISRLIGLSSTGSAFIATAVAVWPSRRIKSRVWSALLLPIPIGIVLDTLVFSSVPLRLTLGVVAGLVLQLAAHEVFKVPPSPQTGILPEKRA